ncbi:MAG: hypothetical protein CMN30_14985 [Sandaracinus sp.]|mgnify:CR=1 FL=1|nr:hypothetical protein [Sandaracinus sp.]
MHPVVFQLTRDLALHSFGVAMALGLLASWYAVVGPAPGPCRALRARAFVALLGGAVVGGLVGRLFGGGGLSLGILLGLAFLRLVGTPRSLGPHAAVALGLMVHAWGAGVWLDGAVFGYPLGDSAPVWLRSLGLYDRWADGTGAPALFAQIDAGWLPLDANRSLATHPVGLYYAVLGAALAAYAALARKRAATPWVVLALFAVARMLLDGLRDDLSEVALAAERGLACALLLAATVGIWIWLARPAEPTVPQPISR